MKLEEFFAAVCDVLGVDVTEEITREGVLATLRDRLLVPEQEQLYAQYLATYAHVRQQKGQEIAQPDEFDLRSLCAHALGIHDGNAGLEPRSMSTLVTDVGKRTEGQVKPQAFGDLVRPKAGTTANLYEGLTDPQRRALAFLYDSLTRLSVVPHEVCACLRWYAGEADATCADVAVALRVLADAADRSGT